ncbi:acyl- -binding domain-containing 4 [Olea europaea subsp. europaea]|uniref:Acyl- -binding domain-containing 4 n=1 Tax=Olea europaea subsp. europaea TaxID=158383 RepID=A0A8S0UJ22_OLEEU|nr:acyl- -binding domain-containing 4 [Olea europaea subsp. europaea]
MASTEAMSLFVKILEEEDPGWYSGASHFVSELVDVVKESGLLGDDFKNIEEMIVQQLRWKLR